MPRAGWRKPESDRRLSDLVSVGVLTRVFPASLVDEVIAEAGRTQQRHRSLPARVMAYFAIGMGLYSEGSYEDVLTQLTDGLAWASGWRESLSVAGQVGDLSGQGKVGIGAAGRVVRAGGAAVGPGRTRRGSWLADRRLVAIDGTCLDVADTPVNEGFFGRPGVNKGEKAAFPQARLLALAECGTHAIFAAKIGAYRDGEAKLAEDLLADLSSGMLLLADRGFFSYALWRKASSTGADLLWRVRMGTGAPAPILVEDLPDAPGWRTCAQVPTGTVSRCWPALSTTPSTTAAQPTTYRLVTTLLDPAEAPAT